MKKIIMRVFHYVSSAATNFTQGKSTTAEKVALSALIFAMVLALILVATIRYWIVPVLGIAFFGYLIYEQRPKAPPAPVFNLLESAYRELFKVFAEIHDRIGAQRPLDIHDITMTPPMAIRNGVQVIKAKIAKSKRGQADPDDLRLYAKIIQARIIDHLRAGTVENIPFASLDNQVPIFWVVHVYDDLATLYIVLIVVDTDDKLRFVINSQFAEAAPPPEPPIDEDF